MVQLNKDDVWGFLAAAALTTAPMLGLTWYGDNMSKDGPIGLPVYIMPAVVGLAGAAAASTAAVVGRQRPDELRRYVVYGHMTGLLLTLTYCGWMNWWFRLVSGRDR